MIRRATLQDLPALLALGVEMVDESPAWSRFVFSPSRTSESVGMLIQSEDGFVWVGEHDGAIVGFLIGMASPHWACEAEMVSELLLYVHPAARGSTLAARLISHLMAWAEARPARPQIISVGTSTGVQPDLTRRLYERLGFSSASIGLERVHV